MKFLQLIPIKNIIIIAIGMLAFNYGFLSLQNIPLALTNTQFILLVLSVVCLSSSGYAIVNFSKKEYKHKNMISENSVYNIYATLNIIGVGIGFYLSNVIGKPSFVAVFILISSTIYIYGVYLSKIEIAWSAIKVLLLPLSILLIGIYEIYPATYQMNQMQMKGVFSILLDYALFAFAINGLIEFISIYEEKKILSLKNARIITSVLILLILVFLFYYINTYFISFELYISTIYGLLCVIVPLLYIGVKIWYTKKTSEYLLIKKILELVLFLGILSIVVVTFNIANNA